MEKKSKAQEYAKSQGQINLLGGAIFIGVTAAFILTATQMFNAAWKEWWVGLGGLSLGCAVALASSIVMDHALGRKYQQVSLPLWEYVLLRFRFLLVLFLAPMAVAVVIGALVTTYYRGPLAWSMLLARALALVLIIVLAGYVLPYFFGRITGAESVGPDTKALANRIAERIGVTIQGVYQAPLDGLRGANAVQIGFLQGRKVVHVLGDWETHFTKDELEAVLAHEFAHAKHDHARKLVTLQLLCRLGVPALIFLAVHFAIAALQIPRPAPVGVVLAFIVPSIAVLVGSHLLPAWMARKYEAQADLRAAEVSGAGAMMSALRKLAELNLIPKERAHLLSTHPSIADRIGALQNAQMPSGESDL